MYQRILIPIDGSSTSLRALREALKLANRDSVLRLIYVQEEFYLLDAEGFAFIDYETLQQALRHTGERALAQAVELARHSGATVESALLQSDGENIAGTIGNEASNWHAELIVLGTHGRSGLNRLLLGSVAEGVVRLATVPVLLVRAE